ncbi:MAG: penicillin-binding protein 2 [Nitrospirae bacterium]|nr:penicillin-binding protein 2 [Nitrospirota bacterium]
MRNRVVMLNIVIFLGFGIVFFRLVDIMIFKHELYSARVRMQTTAKEEIQVRRGIIFDRNGNRLAGNMEYNSIYCNKKMLNRDSNYIRVVSKIIDLKYVKLASMLEHKSNYILIKRNVPDQVLERLRNLNTTAFEAHPDAKRYYAGGDFASHIIGFVDIDNNGREGLEAVYNKFLMNTGGTINVNRDARGNRFYDESRQERIGNDLVLTIDQTLQYIVETEMDKTMDKWKAKAATVIMIEPHTGEILALANRPSFNPNFAGDYNPESRNNRSITNIYEPGSTFKIVTATGVLEENLLRKNELFDVSAGYIMVGGKKIKDDHKHDKLTFPEIIEKSSNVGTIMLAERLGKQRVYNYIKKFGFGQKTGIDLSGESKGLLTALEHWSGVSIGSMPIGQEVGVTPLQMAVAYSIIANGGYKIIPHIVKTVISPEGKSYEINRNTLGEQIVSTNTVNTLTDALIMVTSVDGTAKDAAVQGNEVAGKTGTAEIFDKQLGKYSANDYVSSFVGFVPAKNPAFVLIVVIWKPRGTHYGGVVAAPAFREIAEKSLTYLNIPRENVERKNITMVSKVD